MLARSERGRWRHYGSLPSEAAELRDHDGKESVAWSPDGRYVASGTSMWSEVEFWDVRTRKLIRGPPYVASPVAFLRSGKLLMARWPRHMGPFTQFPECGICSVPGGKEAAAFGYYVPAALAAWGSGDGLLVATGRYWLANIDIWDAYRGKRVAQMWDKVAPVLGVAFAEDGRWVRWERLDPPALERPGDGRHLPSVAGAFDLTLRFDRGMLELDGLRHGARIRFGEFSAGELDRRRHLGIPPRKPPKPLAILRKGAKIAEVRRESMFDWIWCYSFTPDGKLVVGSEYNLTLHDVRRGQTLRGFLGHRGRIRDVAVSRDGELMASGSEDGTFRLWHVKSGELLMSVCVSTDGEWIAWAPTGHFDASEKGGRLLGWHVNRGPDRQAAYVQAWQIARRFQRPDVMRLVFRTQSVSEALRRANAEAGPEVDKTATVHYLSRMLPPIITLREPVYGTTAPRRRVRVRATVESDLPLKRVSVLVNEQQTYVQQTAEVDVSVDLRGGDNVVAVSAENTGGLAMPVRARVRVRESGP